MKRKRIGLIGAGGFGEKHLLTIARLEEEGMAKLVAVADPAPLDLLREQMADRGVPWFNDYRRMLREVCDLDVAVISTPIAWHEEMLGEALESGVDRILLEKPAVPTLRQLENLIARDDSRRTRVGFQLIHGEGVQEVKELLASGRAGRVRSIRVAAGAPRSPTYYARASWAGRLVQNGRAVFDGPATNALAHLLHSALYFAGTSRHEFARPRRIRGFLGRARRIEAYDFAWIEADLGGVSLHAALAHCVAAAVPHELRIVTDKGFILFQGRRITAALEGIEFLGMEGEDNHVSLYRALLREEPGPSTLEDVRGFTILTNAALASAGINDIPHREEENGAIRVEGLDHFLRGFCEDPCPPAEAGLSWAREGAWIDGDDQPPLDLEAFCPR